MAEINTNINNPYNNATQNVQARPQPVRIPSYYVVPEKKMSLKETMETDPMLSIPYSMGMKPFIEHPVALIGTWLGLSAGLDAYSKACGGDYDKSLVHKATLLGDKIENSKFVQSKPMQTVLQGTKKAGSSINNLLNKSAIIRAMKTTPTMPELEMVKTQMFSQKQEVVQDFIRITDMLKLNTVETAKLKDLGLNKSEINMLKKAFNCSKISQIPEEKAVNQVLLHRLGKTPQEIKAIQNLGAKSVQATKDEILKLMGLTKENLTAIKKDTTGKYISLVEKAAGKTRGKVRVGAGHYKWLGPLTKPFERTFGCDIIYNKLHSMGAGAKTSTGRFLSKSMQVLHRGLTFGSGKLAALIFIAPCLLDVAISTMKADKDQKVGTAANGLVNNISWVLTFPLALKIMHSIGGIKYAGMGKDKVEQYRKLINDFNDKVVTTIEKDGKKIPNPNMFKTKKDYDIAKSQLKQTLKGLKTVTGPNGKKQNIFTRGIRKVAGLLTPDLGQIKSYRNGSFSGNLTRKIPQGLRNMGGVPARLILWGAISMGVLDTLLSKGVSSIFGKSYDITKDDERKANRRDQETFLRNDLNKRLYEAQRQKQYGTPATTSTTKNGNAISSKGYEADAANNEEFYNSLISQQQAENIANNQTQNIFNKDLATDSQKVDNYTYIPSQNNVINSTKKENSVDNYTYIPSQNSTIKNAKGNEKQRRYIPSEEAANITKTYDNSGLQSVLDRAQRAEDKALKVLAGNFDNM